MELLPEKDLTRWVYVRPTEPARAIPIYITPPPSITEVWAYDGLIAAGGSIVKELLPQDTPLIIKGFIRSDLAYEFRVHQGLNATKILHSAVITGVANEVIKVDITRSAHYVKMEMVNLDAVTAANVVITLIEGK